MRRKIWGKLVITTIVILVAFCLFSTAETTTGIGITAVLATEDPDSDDCEYGHDWDDGEVTLDPTCEEEGIMTYTCNRCGETYDEPIPTTEHIPEVLPREEPSCEEDGWTEGSQCDYCGLILVKQQRIPATGHTPKTVRGYKATCEEDGLSDGSVCAVCGEELVEQEEIAATGHVPKVLSGNPATCTRDGLTGGSKCAVCGKILEEQEIIDAIGHSYNNVLKEATMTEDGSITKVCRNCQATGKVTLINKIQTVRLDNTEFTYNGSVQKPKVILQDSAGKNIASKYYTVSYSNANSKKVGKYTVTVTFSGNYAGTEQLSYTIRKAKNPLTVKKKSVTYNRSSLTKAQSFSIGVSKKQGNVTFTPAVAAKKAGIKVTNKGKVTVPKKCKAGTYKIIVNADGNRNYKAGSKTVTVKVIHVPVSAVSLNKKSLSLVAGETATLTAKVKPNNATNKKLVWSSSNSKVATVSSKGIITAKKAGKATITVKTKDGGKKASCKVSVREKTAKEIEAELIEELKKDSEFVNFTTGYAWEVLMWGDYGKGRESNMLQIVLQWPDRLGFKEHCPDAVGDILGLVDGVYFGQTVDEKALKNYAKTYFNVGDKAFEDFIENFKSSPYHYYKNGKLASGVAGWGTFSISLCGIQHAKLKNGLYYVDFYGIDPFIYHVANGNPRPSSGSFSWGTPLSDLNAKDVNLYHAVLEKKTIDGEVCWCLHSLTQEKMK